MMFRILTFLLILAAALTWSACSRENQMGIIDNPPHFDPDTLVETYYADVSLGNAKLPSDTIFTDMQYDQSSPGQNLGYDLEAHIGYWPSLILHWEPLSADERSITAGVYKGCCSIALTDTSRQQIEQWILSGRDQQAFPVLDSMPFHIYSAEHVSITVSNVVDSVLVENLGGYYRIIDRATVRLNGVMEELDTGGTKVISGTFECYFSRISW